MSEKKGKVYLVGAGIGNLDYLTVKATKILSQAEVLIYDALIDSELLNLVPSDCLKLDVGKRGGLPSTSQNKINQLLVAYCRQGKQVIRLKSGDPMVFGRVYPEMQALQASDCDFELIPGISSALAAPLLTGIPLTDKDFGRCFVVFSGHEPDSLDWETLAKIETLVILMGGQTLSIIAQQLQTYGRKGNEPIAIIRNCGRREQQLWVGTLENIVEKTTGVSLSPSIIIIGEVVNLRIMPHTFSLPLNNKTVLITRAAEQSSQFSQLLQQQGAKVIEMPALEICPPSSWKGLDQAIDHLNEFDWLILTSANGVEYFLNRLADLGKDVRVLAGVKIAVVGQKTAAILQQKGLKPDFIPPDFVADALVAHFPEPLAGKKVLFPRVETGGREILVKELSLQGAQVIEVAAYESRCPQEIEPQVWKALQDRRVNIVTFASSKTVQNFYQLLGTKIDVKELLEEVYIASIGPQTSKTCYELLGRVDIEAQEYTLEGLTEAVVKLFLS